MIKARFERHVDIQIVIKSTYTVERMLSIHFNLVIGLVGIISQQMWPVQQHQCCAKTLGERNNQIIFPRFRTLFIYNYLPSEKWDDEVGENRDIVVGNNDAIDKMTSSSQYT